MPKQKKKFIDKKNAVTFHLVHRSQKDPLQADEDAPQRILLPADESLSTEIRREEQIQHGIEYDDDYDYLQHLKGTNEINDVGPGVEVYRLGQAAEAKKGKGKKSFELSSDLFASEMETEVGLLNMAAPISGPQLDWDPDIVAALDDDFDFDDPRNELDDDFITNANNPEAAIPEDDDELEKKEATGNEQKDIWADVYAHRNEVVRKSDVSSSESEDEDDEVGSLQSFGEVETKSHFTNYSMSSSVLKRNAELTLLDERFEKLLADFTDDQIGDLDDDVIEGSVRQNSLALNQILDKFEATQNKAILKYSVKKAAMVEGSEPPEKPVTVRCQGESLEEKKARKQAVNEDGRMRCQEEKEHQAAFRSTDQNEEVDNFDLITIEPRKEKWDCVSILSTYSNLYNHPKQLVVPSRTKKPSSRVSESVEEVIEEPREKPVTVRCKGESLEEKKARKQAVKEENRMRRQDKKEREAAYKTEVTRQKRIELSTHQAVTL